MTLSQIMRYRAYNHRLSFSGLRGLLFAKPQYIPIAIILKLLRSKTLECETDIEEPTFSTRELDPNTEGARRIEKSIIFLERKGFEVLGYDSQCDNGTDFTSALLYNSGEGIVAILIDSLNEKNFVDEQVVGLSSSTRDGQCVNTGNPNGFLPTPPFVERKVIKSKNLDVVLELHLDRIKGRDLEWKNLMRERVIENQKKFVGECNKFLEEIGIYERIE